MAETLILPEITISVDDWAWNDQFGAYTATIAKTFSLTAGEKYLITCDGDSNDISAAHDISGLIGVDMVAVGDLSSLGLPANNGRYIIGDGGSYNMFLLTFLPQSNQPGNYTFSVYHVVEEEEPETPPDEEISGGSSIVLRDRNGKPIEYPGIERIKLNTTDGGVQNFGAYDPDTLTPDKLAKGVTVGDVVGDLVTPEIVENLPIALDFTNGNQPVIAPDGTAVKSAIIQQPDTLIPENIAEGVEIAGIIGILSAGGGLGKISYGTVKNSNGAYLEVEHGLGCVPDVIFVVKLTNAGGETSKDHLLWGISKAFGEKVGAELTLQYYMRSSGNNGSLYPVTGYIDTVLTNSYNTLHKATAEHFYLPANMDRTNTFIWYAIGGLT